MKDILIVEDGLHERERLKRLFSAARYSVLAAESASEAEQLIASEQFRLVILDIGLEDKSGSHLFEILKGQSEVPHTIILTGNPSTHLKQRFLDEGAHAYIVKASPGAGNDALLQTVRSILGESAVDTAATGIALGDFAKKYLSESSRELFLDPDQQFPACTRCGGRNYIVSFAYKTQLPPIVEGKVQCADCTQVMDPEVG